MHTTTADNHYPPVTLDGGWFGRGTRAHWARRRATRLIVFVHGFGGDPIDTWTGFPSVLRSVAELADCDFLFYGYDGLTTQANNSAAKLHDFLRRYLEVPADVINTHQPVRNGRAAFAYDRIVIAAHSLGAVVTRRALLRAETRRRQDAAAVPWLANVRLVLFAPAHFGSYPAEIVSSYLMEQDWWVAKIAGAFSQFKVMLLKDLERDSPLIAKLLTDTKAAAEHATSSDHYAARQVLWAEDENIVYNEDFFEDAIGEIQNRTDHRSVCKPDSFGHVAAKAVLEAL